MTETVIPGSRAKGLLLLAVSVAFTAAGVFLLPGTDEPLMVWLCIGVFGLGSLVALAMVLRPSELRLHRDGFTVRTLWRSFDVAWDDVERFHAWKNPAAAQTLAAWTYRPGRRPTGPLAEASASLGAEGAMPGMLTLSADEIVTLMNHHLELRRQ